MAAVHYVASLCALVILLEGTRSDARALLQDAPCNPCYSADGSRFICCNGGSCGPFDGDAPTCNGGTTIVPAGSGSTPAATTGAPVGSGSTPTATTGAPAGNGGSQPSSATPMVNGACASGLNPCYVADGSSGYCCATSCANGGMVPLCTGDPEGGASSGSTLPVSGPVAPTPKTEAPTGISPTGTSPNGTGTITPTFKPALVPTSGSHAVVNADIGIAPMHGTPVPFTNKVLMIDRTDVGPSKLFLPGGGYAYAGEYDCDSNTIRAISVPSNTWCSAGSYLPDGTIVNNGGGDGTGGFSANAGIRTFTDGGNLVQVSNTKVTRWYPTAHALPDGRVLMVGGDDITGSGANQASYEFFPADGQDAHPLELLARENVVGAHLYPFLHLIPDGRVFVFAATSSVLLDYNSGATTKLPDLPGNVRQYPLAGASILLPLDYLDDYRPQVMVCGGGNPGSTATPASTSCGTIDLSSPNPQWAMSNSPSARVMGYLVYLLDGTIFYTGGAHDGYSGYYCSTSPNQQPDIYDPTHDTWQTVQSTASFARLYHHSAFLIPDGRVIIHGSNPRPNYDFGDPSIFVSQTAVEMFSPWYTGASNRPSITAISGSGALGGTFAVSVRVPGAATLDASQIRVALVNPGFATHTVTMSQRYVRLALASANGGDLTVRIPSNPAVLPPGPYVCTVLYQGVPSPGRWISVQA